MTLRRDIGTFGEFWPVYLREHTCARCRAVHYLAATAVVAIVATTACLQCWWLLLAAPFAAYGLAWIGHFAFEKNRPATFTYPLWSLAADFRMWWLWLTGRLGPELERAGVQARK